MRFTGGLPETVCGAGSTLETTEHLRGHLPGLLACLGVETLLDAPCGDANWIRYVNLRGIDYIGCDMQHLDTATSRANEFRAESVRFFKIDILTGNLPRADAVLCRDFLQHLPTQLALRTIRNFVHAGMAWLLLTSFDNDENEDIDTIGAFRRLNLMAPPFEFPEPKYAVEDPPDSGRFIGVWANGWAVS
jgi:hypothetical protein